MSQMFHKFSFMFKGLNIANDVNYIIRGVILADIVKYVKKKLFFTTTDNM